MLDNNVLNAILAMAWVYGFLWYRGSWLHEYESWQTGINRIKDVVLLLVLLVLLDVIKRTPLASMSPSTGDFYLEAWKKKILRSTPKDLLGSGGGQPWWIIWIVQCSFFRSFPNLAGKWPSMIGLGYRMYWQALVWVFPFSVTRFPHIFMWMQRLLLPWGVLMCSTPITLSSQPFQSCWKLNWCPTLAVLL